ncbi:DUF4352 domain-containing protein [Actinoplanes sp. URMC 104]|uniref:DUF4352 domain-containing protein n=1 Tax=Actinoplanes sp. URMC 104 TaxID=3423409 RepID=UPI003F1A16D6
MGRLRTTLTAAALFSTLLLAGCGEEQPDNGADTAAATTAAATTPPAAPFLPSSAAPPPSSAPAETTAAGVDMKLSTEQPLTDWDGDLRVTVLGYRQPVATSAPRPEQNGYEYGSLMVKVCNADDHTQTVNTTPFRLVYADDTEIESASHTYDSFPKPEFPLGDHSLAAGRCVKGSIVFVTPRKQKPKEASYVVDAFADDDNPLEMNDGSVYYWTVR